MRLIIGATGTIDHSYPGASDCLFSSGGQQAIGVGEQCHFPVLIIEHTEDNLDVWYLRVPNL